MKNLTRLFAIALALFSLALEPAFATVPQTPTGPIGAVYDMGFNPSGTFIPFSLDATGALNVNCSACTGGTTALMPFGGGDIGDSTGANQSVGIAAFNPFTGGMDGLQTDINHALVISSAASNPTPWTPIIVSGSTTGNFGATVCPSGTCIKQVKTGAGVLGDVRFNSNTSMDAGTIVTCYDSDGTTPRTIDTELFTGQAMSPGETDLVPAAGFAFVHGLYCTTNTFIQSAQAILFGVR